jgi:hypothetical protein
LHERERLERHQREQLEEERRRNPAFQIQELREQVARLQAGQQQPATTR